MTGKIINLIKRDLCSIWVERQGPYLLIPILIVLSVAPPIFKYLNVLFILMLIQMYANNTFRLEETNRTEKFFASMPVRRRDIVLARYLTVVALVLFHLVLAYTSNQAFNYFSPIKLKLPAEYFAIVLIITSLLTSLSYPFYFKFGPTKVTSILTFTIALLFYGSLFVAGQKPELALKIRSFSFTDIFTTSLILTVIAILVFVVSIKVSSSIYSKKDL